MQTLSKRRPMPRWTAGETLRCFSQLRRHAVCRATSMIKFSGALRSHTHLDFRVDGMKPSGVVAKPLDRSLLYLVWLYCIGTAWVLETACFLQSCLEIETN